MKNLPMRWVIPGIMVPLFAVSLWRAEAYWERCNSDGSPCFPFPSYLPYEIAQAIDLSWPGFALADAVGSLPKSIDSSPYGKEDASWLVPLIGVTLFWFLVGSWWDRLRSNRRLQSKLKRRALWVAFFIVGFPTASAIFRGVPSGWEGPLMTDSPFVPLVILSGMALIELGAFPALLQKIVWRLLLAGLMLTMFVVADAKYQDREATYRAEVASDAYQFVVPPDHAPEVLDVLTLQGLAIATEAFPWEFRLPVIYAYWLAVFTLIAGTWSVYGWYQAIRPILRGLYAVVFAFALFAWIFARGYHGYIGSFGALLGCGIVIYALRPRKATLS